MKQRDQQNYPVVYPPSDELIKQKPLHPKMKGVLDQLVSEGLISGYDYPEYVYKTQLEHITGDQCLTKGQVKNDQLVTLYYKEGVSRRHAFQRFCDLRIMALEEMEEEA